MSVTVNVVILVLYGLATSLIMSWHGPGVSSEYVFVVACVVFINVAGSGGRVGVGDAV
jgi:hypothetical protein